MRLGKRITCCSIDTETIILCRYYSTVSNQLILPVFLDVLTQNTYYSDIPASKLRVHRILRPDNIIAEVFKSERNRIVDISAIMKI